MLKLLALLYILAVVLFCILAPGWARRKSREFKNIAKPSAYQAFFFGPRPRNWYVSIEFCLGFALAGLVCALLIRAFS